MSGNYLLDTNIVIALFANDQRMVAPLGAASSVAVPSIVLGELYYGAQRSTRRQENLKRVNDFASVNTVLNCDADTASVYGEVKRGLSEQGRPIPENDVWIAALALQHELTLVTRDSHFDEIHSLVVESWNSLA